MVNGLDHRPLERNSSTFSDFDDEEEDYVKEVSPITLANHKQKIYIFSSFSACVAGS